MKGFIKWKILIITCAVCLLPILFGLALWKELPEMVAIHFDMHNNPDNFASKGFAVFGLPVLMTLLQIFCCFINDINAKKYGERKKFSAVTKWIIPIMALLLQGAMFAYALGAAVDVRRFAMAIVGAVLIIIGNYMPKFNYIKNVSAADTESARKINRFIGFLSVILGILAIVTIFLPPDFSVFWLFLLIPYAVVSVVYSLNTVRKQG